MINGLHDDAKRAMALECAVEITAARGEPKATKEAAELFHAFLTGQPQTQAQPKADGNVVPMGRRKKPGL